MSYNIVSMIPARGGSKGIPKKNLYHINGKPLMEYMIDTSIKSRYIGKDRTYVSTEDDMIKKFCINCKGIKVIDRPSELASDQATTESVMEHFTDIVDYDIIVLLQATSPLLKVNDLDSAIEKFIDRKIDGYDSCFSCLFTNDILIWDISKDKPINYDPLNRGTRQNRVSKLVIETGAFFITTREQFLKTGCRIGKKPMYHYIDYWTHFQVDNIEDAEKIGRLME